MRRTYSYTEAVKILGGKDHPVVAALDKLLGGALLAGSLGLWQVLDLFDAKPDFTRLFSDLVNKVSEKRRGLSRYDRTQRLHAAHAVIVVTAFFETFQSLGLWFSLTPEDDEHVVAFAPFDLDVPLPSAARPYEENLSEILSFYRGLTNDLISVMTSLAAWDRLNETEQDRLADALEPLAETALGRYAELFRQLAVDFPEVAFWCSLEDHRATRSALARLEDALRETIADHTADERLAELAGVYGSALGRPLVRSAEVPAGLRMPTLGEAYVDPRFQLLSFAVRSTVPSMAEVWNRLPERSDLYAYLVGHLTSLEALVAPLLVLGDPGSGKSVLTEMLAARLPAADFAVVRVELRSTPVDADLVRQIEHGLHRLLDEPVSWAEFSRRTGGALPVVILDGLDELMQATGVSQTRYLSVIAEFQDKLLAKSRPAVFVVTSRLSVCAGVELPEQSHVVRLLPFSDDQVRQWLDVWNARNKPLPADVALSYPALAEQPLLLLLLALYDAVDSALQRDHASLSQGQLYERLLREFGRREVTKSGLDRTDADLHDDIETELERLSVVGLAMFNRGAQWVAEHEVTADLASLLGVESFHRPEGTHTRLSSGESVLGRFFFVQTSEAVREDHTKLRTYEFLHATFGEYLVARYVWRTLLD
ncbi:MAG TPA: ATP-binding protein, partial [Lentzea sp.]